MLARISQSGLLRILACALGFLQVSESIQFQSKDLNAGRARLVLYQGKTRYEVIGKACPVGVSFIKPERFSCACVTGVWAFYDITCAAPFIMKGGVNHCFTLPLDTYLQHVLLISNPTRAHADALTIFEGDFEEIKNKFYRATHTVENTTNSFAAVGPKWSLTSPEGSQVCLDATEHPAYEEVYESPTSTAAYCLYENVSRALKKIGSVSAGCKEDVYNIKPSVCWPYARTNSDQVCTDLSVLEAYESAVEDENNDISIGLKKPREFIRQVRAHPTMPTTTTTTTTTTPSPKSMNTTMFRTSSAGITPAPTAPLHHNILQSPDLGRGIVQAAVEAPSVIINPIGADKLALGGAEDIPMMARQQRAPQTDVEDNTKLTREQMKAIYQEAVKNVDTFLVLDNPDSNERVLEMIWAYQRNEIKKALELSTGGEAEEKNQMETLLHSSMFLMYQKCPAIPIGFLQLSLEAFTRMQREWYRVTHRFIRKKDLDDILESLRRCATRTPPYDFVNPSNSTCVQKNPTHIYWENGTQNVEVPEMYKWEGNEPVIEAVWKMAVHTLIFCNSELSTNIRLVSDLTILYTEIFSNEINLIWRRNKTLEHEYGGVIGDMKTIMNSIDICLGTAIIYSDSKLNFSRPAFRPAPGWVPPNSDEDEMPNETPTEAARISRNIDGKYSYNEIQREAVKARAIQEAIVVTNFATTEGVVSFPQWEGTTTSSIMIDASTTEGQPEAVTTGKVTDPPLTSTTSPTSTPKTTESTTARTTAATSTAGTSIPGASTTAGPALSISTTAPKLSTTSTAGTVRPTVTTPADLPTSTVELGMTTPASVISLDSPSDATTVPQESSSTTAIPLTTLKMTTLSPTTPGTGPSSKTETTTEGASSENESDESGEEDETTAAPGGEKKSRQKRTVFEAIDNTELWKKNREILGVMYCLKKFDDAKVRLGHHCDF